MSGLIGSALRPELEKRSYEIVRLKTGTARQPNEIAWEPLRPLDAAQVSGFDAVIHLAGENIFGRWTKRKKKSIYESRVLGTRHLCAALAACASKPKVLLAASAVGFYGSHHDELLTEASANGKGFLADLAWDWEAATEPARRAGIRVVNLRSGIVLSRQGGALAMMLPIFRLGLGGKIGSGKQWMSWIAIEDEVAAILFCLDHEEISGPVNLAAPNPVTNADFALTLARAVHRPAFFGVPEVAVRLLLGSEMAEETVLASQRVAPEKLQRAGFEFKFATLADALRVHHRDTEVILVKIL
jgi:uncharacterized protein (TIGR01777 family)